MFHGLYQKLLLCRNSRDVLRDTLEVYTETREKSSFRGSRSSDLTVMTVVIELRREKSVSLYAMMICVHVPLVLTAVTFPRPVFPMNIG
jgi:hypothetical protein